MEQEPLQIITKIHGHQGLISYLESKIANIKSKNSCLYEKYADRDIHNYFYKLSFKGVDFEKTQVKFLFTEPEFINQAGYKIDLEQSTNNKLVFLRKQAV